MTRPIAHAYEPGLWDGVPCAACGLESSSVVHVAPVAPTRLARKTDPSTSKAGARSVSYRAGTQKARLLLAHYAASRPLTDAEAAQNAELLTKPGCCWWHRCSDLRADGMLEVVGEGTSPITGEAAMLSTLTERGLAAAERLVTL